MNCKKVIFQSACLAVVMFGLISLSVETPIAGMADGDSKFLGNIFQGSVDTNFSTYWNQVTLENAGKWNSVEPTWDNMSWNQLDIMFNLARGKSLPIKQHTFIWGSAQPSWITGLSLDQQRVEVAQWINQFCQRYPDVQFIDVVNEPLNDPPAYKNAIGGDGVTGWDWVIWAFQQSRTSCPQSKLLINEYDVEINYSTMTNYISLIQILKGRGLLDGVGVQGHSLESMAGAELKASLDRLATLGLPIYISELDIQGDDNTQLAIYQRLFPVMWEHPGVYGITLWGYKQNLIWRPTAYLLQSDGTERPALTWLKNYVAANPRNAPSSPINLRVQ